MTTASWLSFVLTALVALLHLAFLVLETFLWRTPFGRRIFRMTREKSEVTAPLAANQGLYNGFLAAGLVWSLVEAGGPLAFPLRCFFLACVVVAGVVGGFTAARSILLVQALPGALALGATLAARFVG